MIARLAVLLLGALVLAAPARAGEAGNAALLYWEAAGLVVFPTTEEGSDGEFQSFYADVLEGKPFDLERVDRVLKNNARALALIDRAASLDRCDFGTALAPDPEAGPTGYMGAMRQVFRVLRLSARGEEARHAWAKAGARYLEIIRVARHLDAERVMVSSLGARSMAAWAVEGLGRVALGARDDPGSLRDLAAAVVTLPERPLDLAGAFDADAALAARVFGRFDGERWIQWLGLMEGLPAAMAEELMRGLKKPAPETEPFGSVLRRCIVTGTATTASGAERAAVAATLKIDLADLASPAAFTAAMGRKVAVLQALERRVAAALRRPAPWRGAAYAAIRADAAGLYSMFADLVKSCPEAAEKQDALDAALAKLRADLAARR